MTYTTSTTPSLALRSAAKADLGTVTSTLAQAFHDDPLFAWCLPDASRRAEVLPAFFELAASAVLPYQESQVSVDGIAAALWIPAGQSPVPEHDAPAFEARIAEIVGDDADRTFAIMTLLDEHHPTADHRFLWFLGVQPHAQGRGAGSALLRSMLSRCDREGTAAYLDATSVGNRRLYERHGFAVVAERSVDGSPPLWPMWREPQPVAR